VRNLDADYASYPGGGTNFTKGSTGWFDHRSDRTRFFLGENPDQGCRMGGLKEAIFLPDDVHGFRLVLVE